MPRGGFWCISTCLRLRRKSDEKVEKCDFLTIFQKSQIGPKPSKMMFWDPPEGSKHFPRVQGSPLYVNLRFPGPKICSAAISGVFPRVSDLGENRMEKIEKCDFWTIFQKSQIGPKPSKMMFWDSPEGS